MAVSTSDFLNPKATLTPGVAGALTMLLTNTLSSSFSVPSKLGALIISFLIGLFVFAAPKLPWFKRAGYYVVNSLIIFSVATGSNQVGVHAAEDESEEASGAAVLAETGTPFFSNWLDGTVSKRSSERDVVSQVDDAVARQAVADLQAAPPDERIRRLIDQGQRDHLPPKVILDRALTTSRKATDVEAVSRAVQSARQRPPR